MNYYKHIIILLAALLSILPMESRAGFTPRFEQFPTNNICIYALNQRVFSNLGGPYFELILY